MRTLPFLSKDFLTCSRCRDFIPVDRRESAVLLGGGTGQGFVQRLETYQLAGKSEVQRNFLLTMREGRESVS